MEFYEVIRERFACKKFDSRPVEQTKLDAILEAGRLAPTAKNLELAGPGNVVTMMVDVADKEGFEALLASPAHCEIADKAGEAFCTDSFVMGQIEL